MGRPAILSGPETRGHHPGRASGGENLCEHLATKGYRITEVPVDGQGRLDMDVLYKSLTEDTAIVSVMWANNESG